MGVVGKTLVAAAHLRGAQLERQTQRIAQLQEHALRHLVERATGTAFGARHGFSRIRNHGDFQAAVPLRGYAELQPWLQLALCGERDVTWPGAIPYFAMSSGTTSGNKYLPISMDSVRQQQRGGFDPLAAYLRWTADDGLLDGKALMLGSSSALERRPGGTLVGDNTGIMAHHMPRIVRRNYLPSPQVRQLVDWDEKLCAVAEEAFDADVRMLAGTPSWFVGLFDQVLATARKRGRPAKHIHDVWPNLRLLTGGGVSFEPYRKLIRSRLGRHVPYVDVYNATEGGIMAVQDQPDDPGMRMLADNGVFYEFVPLEDLEAKTPRRLRLHEVKVGQVYALAVCTMSGLFAYLIGDCLRFVSVYPHRVVFQGRTAAFLNVTGEHVSQGELERAANAACRELGVQLRDFTVVADVGVGAESAVRHRWLIEFDGPVPDSARCAELIDQDISAGNDDYRTHRMSRKSLLPPAVEPLHKGAFDRFMRTQGKLGGQHKVPRVLHDPRQQALLRDV